jgi:hypothetical protein
MESFKERKRQKFKMDSLMLIFMKSIPWVFCATESLPSVPQDLELSVSRSGRLR